MRWLLYCVLACAWVSLLSNVLTTKRYAMEFEALENLILEDEEDENEGTDQNVGNSKDEL